MNHKIGKKNHITQAYILFVCFGLIMGSPNAVASDISCFDGVNVEASFIAITSSKESDLKDWYQKVFGLVMVKSFSFPDGQVEGVLMKRNELVFEIFNRNDLLDKKEFNSEANEAQWNGLMKFGFYSDADLPSLKKCLINQGVAAGRIFNDDNLNVDLLLITDPEGNSIEVISRHSKTFNPKSD